MADNAKEELDIYIRKLSDGVGYYTRWMIVSTVFLIILRLIIFVLPVVTAVIAALAKEGVGMENARPWLVTLPIITSAAALLITQLKIEEFVELQEDYRREFDYLADQGRLRRNTGTEDPATIHRDLLTRAEQFEKAYPAKVRAILGSFLGSRPRTEA